MILNLISNADALVKSKDYTNSFVDMVINFTKNKEALHTIFIIYLILNILILLYLFFRYNLEFKSNFKDKYLTDIPSPIDPEEVEFLFKRNISVKSILANILSVINKRGLLISKGLELGNKKEDIKLTINNSSLRSQLTENETILRDEIVKILGVDGVISINSLKKIKADKVKCQNLTNQYYKWYDKNIVELIRKDMFENRKAWVGYHYIHIFFGILLIIFYYKYNPNVLWLIPGFVAIIIYPYFLAKRSRKYVDAYRKWQAFKRYLYTLNTTTYENLPHENKLSTFLVYSYVLGCQDYMYNMIARKQPKDINMEDNHASDMFDLFANKKSVLLAIWTAYIVALETTSIRRN